MAVAGRGMRERMGGGHHRRACIAIDAIAGRGGKAGMQRLTVQPLGEEGGHHMIANGELIHFRPDGFHHPGTIGHGDAALSGRHLPGHHAKVMKIQRACMQPHPDLTACRLPGVGQGNTM